MTFILPLAQPHSGEYRIESSITPREFAERYRAVIYRAGRRLHLSPQDTTELMQSLLNHFFGKAEIIPHHFDSAFWRTMALEVCDLALELIQKRNTQLTARSSSTNKKIPLMDLPDDDFLQQFLDDEELIHAGAAFHLIRNSTAPLSLQSWLSLRIEKRGISEIAAFRHCDSNAIFEECSRIGKDFCALCHSSSDQNALSESPATTSHHLSDKEIFLYINGMCSFFQRLKIAVHLASCTHCTKKIDDAANALYEERRFVELLMVYSAADNEAQTVMKYLFSDENNRPAESHDLVDRMRHALPGLIPFRKCGKGRNGVVFLARDTFMRRVAVKITSHSSAEDEEARQRLKDYSALVPASENLVTLYQVSPAGQPLCYSMELAGNFNDNTPSSTDNYEPDTLEIRLRRGGAMSLAEIAKTVRQLLHGLDIMHKAGFYHQNITPGNIVFFGRHAKLGVPSATHLQTNSLSVFTPHDTNAPPADTTAQFIDNDLYALGKVIYCMMSGLPPAKFPLLPSETLRQKDLSTLNSFVMQACSINYTERFHSVREFHDAFMQAVPYLATFSRTFSNTILRYVIIAILILSGVVTSLFWNNAQIASTTLSPTEAQLFANQNSMAVTPIRNSLSLLYSSEPETTTVSSQTSPQVVASSAIPFEEMQELYLEFETPSATKEILTMYFEDSGTNQKISYSFVLSACGVRKIEDLNTAASCTEPEHTPQRWGFRFFRANNYIGIFCNALPLDNIKLPTGNPLSWKAELSSTAQAPLTTSLRRLALFGQQQP